MTERPACLTRTRYERMCMGEACALAPPSNVSVSARLSHEMSGASVQPPSDGENSLQGWKHALCRARACAATNHLNSSHPDRYSNERARQRRCRQRQTVKFCDTSAGLTRTEASVSPANPLSVDGLEKSPPTLPQHVAILPVEKPMARHLIGVASRWFPRKVGIAERRRGCHLALMSLGLAQGIRPAAGPPARSVRAHCVPVFP